METVLVHLISDETAYYLANFAKTLATAIDETYSGRTQRYIRNSKLTNTPSFNLSDEELGDPPF